jgi:hypothetical protein
MKNQTLKDALRIGFSIEDISFESSEEFEKMVIDYLNENTERLPKLRDFCEVNGHGDRQYVNYGDFYSSGEIMHYDLYARKHRIYHSSFLYIEEQSGKCYQMNLWDYSK